MKGTLITLFSVTALISAVSVDHNVRPIDTSRSAHAEKTINSDPSKAPAICKAAGSDDQRPQDVLVAHEMCNKFYKCSHGRPIAIKCPPDLLYSIPLEYCDWPHKVECGDRVISKESDNGHGNNDTDEENANCGNNINGDPSQAPAICAQTDSIGVLVAHELCTQFYQCSEGRPVAHRCPPGLLFNPNKKLCDWPYNVNCGNRTIPEANNNDNDNETCNCNPSEAPEICARNNSESVLVAHEHCNTFYKCLHGHPVAYKCAQPLLYNPYHKYCDWPKNVQCGDRVIPEHNNDQEETSDENDDDKEEENQGYSDPSEAPGICAKENSDGVLIANELCNHFYKCLHGIPIIVSCPSGLHFNPGKNQCDWPKNVNCNGRIIPDDKEVPVTEKEKEIHSDPSMAPEICARNNSDGVLVAHERCDKFYSCSSGVPVAQPCPKGLLYNPSAEKCDWPEAVTCGNRVIPDYDNEECDEDDHDKDDKDHDDGDHHGNYDPSQAPDICAKENSDGVLIAHEFCYKYYICANNHPVAMHCANNLFFNPRKNECDWRENVNCGDRIQPDERDDSNNCNNVNNGVLNVLMGQFERHGYDDPNEVSEICAKEESANILLPHEYCNLFYQCVNGDPIPMRCPSNLYFDPKSLKCGWPEDVDCGKRLIPEKKDGSEEDNEENSHGHESNNHDDPSKAPEICAQEHSDGVYVAHEYCNKYYICVNEEPLALVCPGTLLYNPKIEVCDWFWNVDCNKRKIPEDDHHPDDGED